MKLYAIFVVLLFALPQIVEPPEYAKDQFCSPKGTINRQGKVINSAPDHKCTCKHMDTDMACEGTPHESPNCKQYCHLDKCGCPVVCDPHPPAPSSGEEEQ